MQDFSELSNDEIVLRLVRETPADLAREWLPGMFYDILLKPSLQKIGNIDLRIGYTLSVARYGGNFAYGIDPPFRGHHYAGLACILLKQVARAKGMDVIWITCNPDNWPSRKTCEWIGATLVEIVDLPEDNDQYREGERQKCRYRWILY